MSTIAKATVEERRDFANKMKARYPDSVPVVLLRDYRCELPEMLQNYMILAPRNLSAGGFTASVRQKLHIEKTQALIMFIGQKVLITADASISELYDRFADEDGLLYILCTDHAAYG